MITPLDVAISQIGVSEETGRNDGVPAQRYMRGDELPWCSAFLLWCFEKAGAPIHRSTEMYYALRVVENLEAETKRRGVWFGRALEPHPGDIIFFAGRGRSDAGPGRHVGIVEEFDGKTVFTIEGNTSNSVDRRRYAHKDSSITGYARPQGAV